MKTSATSIIKRPENKECDIPTGLFDSHITNYEVRTQTNGSDMLLVSFSFSQNQQTHTVRKLFLINWQKTSSFFNFLKELKLLPDENCDVDFNELLGINVKIDVQKTVGKNGITYKKPVKFKLIGGKNNE